MRKLMILGGALTAFLLPAAAEAQVTLGARLGYAIAGGDAVKDGKLSDLLKGTIPIQLDVGYAVIPDLTIGAFVSYGFGRLAKDVKDACDADSVDCSVSSTVFGVQGLYSFSSVSPTLVPWVGLGVGYESMKFKASLGGESATVTYTGWELAKLQAGADYKMGSMRVGPFLSYSFGQFGKAKLEGGGQSESADITDKGTHTYLTIGVRGQFGL
jgi:hypothetical protein